MKTKAYKLAVELGVQEASLLEWLRAHGYPNVRRADTIRAEVCQAARKALGGRRGPRRGGEPGARVDSRRVDRSPRGASDITQTQPGLRVSFAELLEAHLPTEPNAGDAPSPITATQTLPAMPAVRPEQPRSPAAVEAPSSELRTARAEKARDEALRAADEQRVRAEAALREKREMASEIARLRPGAERAAALASERERMALEISQLKQKLAGADDERQTLEGTAGELQQELDEMHRAIARLESELDTRREVRGELESAQQRELAWRARALELERAASAGGNVFGVFNKAGLGDPDGQIAALRAILDDRGSAVQLLKAIRGVDAEALGRLLKSRIVRVCAHPVCNQVVALDDRVPQRVDSEKDCAVCGGSDDRRWFARMVRECGRAGARRLLVVGGPDPVHGFLRTLSEGQSVDVRLVASSERAESARVRGRVEGCDVLVTWSGRHGDEAQTREYVAVAREERAAHVTVLGDSPSVAGLARAVANRLARGLILTTG